MDNISNFLKQNYSAKIKINKTALLFNLEKIRSKLSPSTQICASIKANAYGLGAQKIALLLQENAVSFFGVVRFSEIKQLRKIDPKLPILVYGFLEKEELEKTIDEKTHFFTFSIPYLNLLNTISQKKGKKTSIHLHFDTGMGRLGFRKENLSKLINTLETLHFISVKGLSTHFAQTENTDFFYKQLHEFQNITHFFQKNWPHSISYIHCSNTDALFQFPESQMTMVRPGIGLYGYSSALNVNLREVFSLYSKVINIKKVEKGENISYGQNFLKKDTQIATLSIGYGDGLLRQLAPHLRIMIKGHHCPIIGPINMDHLMVDVGKAQINIEDEAEIIGPSGRSILEISKNSLFTPYELLCLFDKKRVIKEYF